MNRLRIIGLVLLAVLVVGTAIRSLLPEPPPPPPVETPVREVFHPAKPLRVEVRTSVGSVDTTPLEPAWLERELRYMLSRGQMKLAPLVPQNDNEANPFTLQVATRPGATQAQVRLLAPDGVVERSERIELEQRSRLETMQAFAALLPRLLDAPAANEDWSAMLGTADPAAYDAYLRASEELRRWDALGFTAPPRVSAEATANLERLETLTHRHRAFARARALLALGYLSIGGEDEPALTKLAETAAQRALAEDAQLADARAALGIVRARRMEWSAAREHFAAALALDANSLPALEGLACVLVDTGHTRAALPLARQALLLQAQNRGAHECATYAAIAVGSEDTLAAEATPQSARIEAAMQLLAGDATGAERLLRTRQAASDELIQALIEASSTANKVPFALRIITRSAGEGSIDEQTELLFGAALRRPDFVLNRMLRLAKQGRAVPTRLLWLPHTEFLRKSPLMRDVVAATDLSSFWQDHGVPDICASEPKLHVCLLKRR